MVKGIRWSWSFSFRQGNVGKCLIISTWAGQTLVFRSQRRPCWISRHTWNRDKSPHCEHCILIGRDPQEAPRWWCTAAQASAEQVTFCLHIWSHFLTALQHSYKFLFFPSPSGTFCTLDICLSRLEDIGTVDIKQTVRRMRTQRAFSIQTWDQYYFCYKAVIEYAQQSGLLQPVEWSDTELETDSEWIRRNRTRTRGKEAVFSPLLATGKTPPPRKERRMLLSCHFSSPSFHSDPDETEIVAWCMSCSIFLVLFFYKYWLAQWNDKLEISSLSCYLLFFMLIVLSKFNIALLGG